MASTYPVPTVGTEVTADYLTSMLPLHAVKTADEPVTANITPQNDDELVIPVVASATYIFTGWIRFAAANNTPDLRVDFDVPSGTTMYRSGFGQVSGATTTNGVIETSVNTSAATDDGRGAITSDMSIMYFGTVLTSTTAGNFQFRFAQVTSDAGAITVKAGSWIRLERTA